MTPRRHALAALALLVAAQAPALGHSGHDRRPGAAQFDLEVRVTGETEHGVAPAVAADSYGNLFAVGRKELPAEADGRGGTAARAASWRWFSADGGATWRALPEPLDHALTTSPSEASDVAVVGAGRVYIVDAHHAGAVLHRYRSTGLGAVAHDVSVPVVTGGAPDVAPALAAHGDAVFYLAGSTSRTGAPVPATHGNGYGPGRVAVYRSVDGGASFDAAGYSLRNSDACDVAADPRRGSRDVYVVCVDASRAVVVFASHDDGATFDRVPVGRYGGDTPSPPAVAVTRDGAVRVVVADGGSLVLYASQDGGRTWRSRSATRDRYDRFVQPSLAAAPDGRLGFSSYARNGRRWHVVAGVFDADSTLLVVNFAEHTPVVPDGVDVPPGGHPGIAFTPDSRAAVVWSVADEESPAGGGLLHAVWSVREKPPYDREETPPARTPRYALPPCSVPGQVRQVGDWQAIRAPAFAPRPLGARPALSAYAVDPYDPVRVFATNGTSVLRSVDGGCRWAEVWSLEASPRDGAPYSSGTARVTELLVPDSRTAHGVVYAVVRRAEDAGPPRTWIVRSDSSGDAGSWERSDAGLPETGRAVALRASSTNPDFLYVALDLGHDRGELWASEDGGRTWASREPIVPSTAATRIDALALDPIVPNAVWLVRDGALAHSTDGGRTWRGPTYRGSGPMTSVAVYHDAYDRRVLAWTEPAGGRPATMLESRDNGRTWAAHRAADLDEPVGTAAFGSNGDVVVVSTRPANGGAARLFALRPATRRWSDVSPVAAHDDFRVAADRRAAPTFYALTPDALYRYSGDAIEPRRRGESRTSVYDDLAAPAPGVRVTPAAAAVRLAPGEARTLTYSVDVGAARPKLDVFVLVDTSESMTARWPAIRRDLVASLTRLRESGADVWVGVAQAKTDSQPPAYRRERDVGPLDSSFGAALDRLRTQPGAGLETQLIALEQVIEGSGLPAGRCVNARCVRPPVGTVCEVDPSSPGCDVAPGQQANFRGPSVKVVVHATDTTFRNPEGTPRRADGTIDVAAVAAKFAAAGVLHLGLAAAPEGRVDLRAMAAMTGTLAPPGGVDCDSDGRTDVAAGAPLVCESARALDRVLDRLAGARTGGTHVHFGTPRTSLVVRSVTPHEWDVPVATRPSRLRGVVVVSCAGVAPGRYATEITARAHGGTQARAWLIVECSSGDPPIGPRRPQAGIVAPVPVPPLAPPAPPPAPANPNPQPQPQSQIQPQAGMANDDAQQAQGAVARQNSGSDEELAMSALPRSRPEPAPTLLAGAMLAASLATVRRRTARTGAAAARARR